MPAAYPRGKIRALALCALFTALTAAGAFIRVPMIPVSISLQTMFSLMAGIILGPKLGAASQAVYIFLGLVGIPIFTEGGGIFYVLKPSFGFLLGMVAMTAVTGAVRSALPGLRGAVVACLAGTAALYVVGLPYMHIVLNLHLGRGVDMGYVLYYGLVLFLPGDALKVVCAALAGTRIKGALARSSGAPL